MGEAKPPKLAVPSSPTESVADHQVVVAFVEELDRAQQHIDLVDDLLRIMEPLILARLYNLYCITFNLATINKQHHIYPVLCLYDFRHYVKAYFVARNKNPDLIYIRATLQKKEAYLCSNPAFDLLFKARYHGYVLDENPRVELQKLQKYTPHFYDSLVCREPPVDRQARTVTVSNLSDEVSGEDIWRYFGPCGFVEDVETKSESDGQIAEITFKDVRSAKFAAESGLCTGVGSELRQHEGVPLLIKLNTAASVVKKGEEVSSMYTEALNSYRGIQMLYLNLSPLMNQIKRNIVTHLV